VLHRERDSAIQASFVSERRTLDTNGGRGEHADALANDIFHFIYEERSDSSDTAGEHD
jgi:hypothetical protein